VVAGALIVFASSMDDFVISAFLSPDAASVTVPIKLYSAVRSAPTPALNALATLLLLGSALALVLAWLVLRRRRAGARGTALDEMASIDV
jgi:spermidine/putrescine transport system permease protein